MEKNILEMSQKDWADAWFAKQDSRIDNWLFREFLEHRINIEELNRFIVLYGGFETHEHMWLEYEIEMSLAVQEIEEENSNCKC